MKIALISDIHSNGPALDAVLAHAAGADKIVCLGDVVGYGPDPAYCVRRLRELNVVTVAGNHDTAIGAGRIPAAWRRVARATAEWTQGCLDEAARKWLSQLPTTWEGEGMVATHDLDRSGLSLPFGRQTAPVLLGRIQGGFTAFGHSHLPVGVFEGERRWLSRRLRPNLVYPGGGGTRILFETGSLLAVNPGSVGEPRDGSSGAAYAEVDLGSRVLTFHMVSYNSGELLHHIQAAAMPSDLRSAMFAFFGFPEQSR